MMAICVSERDDDYEMIIVVSVRSEHDDDKMMIRVLVTIRWSLTLGGTRPGTLHTGHGDAVTSVTTRSSSEASGDMQSAVLS